MTVQFCNFCNTRIGTQCPDHTAYSYFNPVTFNNYPAYMELKVTPNFKTQDNRPANEDIHLCKYCIVREMARAIGMNAEEIDKRFPLRCDR